MKSKTMDKGLTFSFGDGVEQFKATLSECIAEIDRQREIIKEDNIRIAQSQSRTHILMAQIEEMMKSRARKAA